MSQPETQLCSNCDAPILVSKLDLHLAFCQRYIRRCAQCSQTYDKRQEAQHKQGHKKQACAVCGQQIQQKNKEQHQLQCVSTNQCPYCENIVKIQQFAVHLEQCSSRTQQCVDCQKYLIKSEMDKHVCQPQLKESWREREKESWREPREPREPSKQPSKQPSKERSQQSREFKRLFQIDDNKEEPQSSRLQAYLKKKDNRQKRGKPQKKQKNNQENQEQYMSQELEQVIMQSLLEF